MVVMGHVDHGKTTLLDFIRKTSVAAREAGGITQSVGAYEIEHNGKKITFIDTPGHEAFTKMRSRGATAADLAILVVAADDGVKPQTKEAIKILKETKTPFVVAINKIDKNNADPERTKKELLENGVLLEGYGGNVPYQPISAKTGDGTEKLLDLVLLAADMEELKYSEDVPARGFVIESKLDRRRGNEVMVIVRDGVLQKGVRIFTPSAEGKVKILEDFAGKAAEELKPSSPALILGFENLPAVGEEFTVGEMPQTDAPLQKIVGKAAETAITGKEEKLSLKLLIKADVAGSLEALEAVIKALPQEEIAVEILDQRVGDVGDGDVKLAIANGAMIIGFRVRVEKSAQAFAQAHNIVIVSGEIIYELVQRIEEAVNNLKSPKPAGTLEVLAVFNQETNKQLVGGKVTDGVVKNNGRYDIKRGEETVGNGRIVSLRQQKQDVRQVEAGKECGMIFESSVKIKAGDQLIAAT